MMRPPQLTPFQVSLSLHPVHDGLNRGVGNNHLLFPESVVNLGYTAAAQLPHYLQEIQLPLGELLR